MKDTKSKAKTKDSKESKKKHQLSVKDETAKKQQVRKGRKATTKDPNKPKRAPTPFFIFMEDFRKTCKEQHPNVKGVAEVGRACGERWKQMSAQEKAPYEAKGVQKKAEYEKVLATYNQKLKSKATADEVEESDKSKSEIEEEEDEEEEDDED